MSELPTKKIRRDPNSRKFRATKGGAIKPEGQWHHGDLRASLIAWGTHLLDSEGIAGMSMRAAAKLAGVSPGAPAHHFQDRNGLLAAIAAQAFRDLVAFRRGRLEKIGLDDAPARLRAVMLAYVEFAQAHPARFHLMFGPEIQNREQYPELVEAGLASFQMLRSAIVPCLQGANAAALREEELAFAVWSATHGLAVLTLDRQRVMLSATRHATAQKLADCVVRFCLAALQGAADVR
ncbi:TetR/AcrR family transcriptional regulator [Burkholderia catarinensis]|uniref:TetR/AcrR family transcriptional regulator n=1 Tax=Burkholderia catarinensis TaxID=1108140 RepID=UPI000913A768|nr:TetR/AcrR family transcriptional regulator [Burkholderia catarinensis]KAG8153801.1 TetR family transcriptional regulator [Burkholderia catarinensis]